MNRTKTLVAAVICLTVVAAGATADVACIGTGGQGNLAHVKVALHATPYNNSKACTVNAPSAFGCDAVNWQSDLVTTWPLETRASVYVVVLDIPPALGLKGATFGVNYVAYSYATNTGVYVAGFELCLDLAFPSTSPAFPTEPGSGVVVTSASCLGTVDASDPQGEKYAVLGWMDATSYGHIGTLALTPRLYLANPDFQVADCTAATSNPCYPDFAGAIGFGQHGWDPCCPPETATEPSSWGRIKRLGGD